MASKRRNICIIARKDLIYNTRVTRQASALQNAGYEVTVVSTGLPHKEQMGKLSQVNWFEIDLPPLAGPFLKAKTQPENSIKSFKQGVHKGKLGLLKKLVSRSWSLLAKPVITGFLWGILAQRAIRGRIALPTRKYNELSLGALLLQCLVPYSRVIRDRIFAHKVQKALGNRQFDFVLSHDTLPLYACFKVAKKSGGKLLFDAVELTENRGELGLVYPPPLWERLRALKEGRIIRLSSACFATSNAQASVTAQKRRIDFPVILRNCRNYQENKPDNRIKRDSCLKLNEKLVLQIGAIVPGRGLEGLIKAIPYMASEVKVAFLGPMKAGYVWENLWRIAEEHKVSHRVVRLEPVGPDDLISYASGADLGIIPLAGFTLNAHLSLPNRIFEMIMARLPMAVAKAPAISELVEQYSIGKVYTPYDPKALAQAVSYVLEPCNYAVFKKSLEKAARDLNWEKESLKLIKVVDELSL